MPKVKVLADLWRRKEKNADGDTVYRRYRKGDVVDVTEREARVLLKEDPVRPSRPMAEKVETTQAVQRTASASSDKK